MKKITKLVLVAVLTLGFSTISLAQKVAHIDAEKLISNMPQTKALKAEIQKLQKTYKDEIETMGKKLEAKYKKYDAEGKTQTQEVNAKRVQELQADRAKLAQAEQAAYQEIQKKQAEKLAPILEKAQKAIQDVAKEKGIAYVLDASRGKGVLVYETGEDLYNAVKAKLGF